MRLRIAFTKGLAPRFLAALGGFTAIAAHALAAPEPVPQCPQFIEQQSVQLINTPAGWTTFVHEPLYLHGAAPMSGPPKELGELADYSEKRDKGAMVYTYKLDAPFPAGKWLSCTYGEGDQISLGMRLADNIKVCTFRQKKGPHVGENYIAINCQ